MAKKHKHEEHVNHERWLVSFADMMTLLFALFVVLYSLGVTELERLRELKESIQFAFHIEGEGKTKDEGRFDKQTGAGDVKEPAPLLNAQDGPMQEFLEETLTQFERVTGTSLEIDQTDDAISLRAPLSSFFPEERPHPLKPDVYNWLVKAAQGAMTFTSDIQVIIETPIVILGSRNGRRVTSLELCNQRLLTLRRVLVGLPEVKGPMVGITLVEQRHQESGGADRGDWQQRAHVVVAFSNTPAGYR